MDQKTFDKFKDLINEKSGIPLGPQKVALVSARVGKRLRALGIDDYNAYLDMVAKDESGNELVQLLDAISTNVTSFFREAAHFGIMEELLRKWKAQGQTRYRIWCAASSTGEEPYCLAMTALEALKDCRGLDLRILATDISTRVLEIARRGEYPADKVEAVPPALRSQYFERRNGTAGNVYQACDILKRLISFNRLNLSTPPYAMEGPFDIVFCRNVMIYFDNAVRTKLLREVHRLLRPSGYLMIGHSESLTGINVPFHSRQPAVYQKG